MKSSEYQAFVYPVLPEGSFIAGTDEAGRGPLCGNVAAGAVILDPDYVIDGINDSKKLTAKKREELFSEIKKHALAWGVGEASPAEIDKLNILNASLLAMERAVHAMKIKPSLVLVDGNRKPKNMGIPVIAVVKGDALVKEIGAASILAKVTRDHELIALDQKYPEYGFAAHKGYPTAAHMAAIKKYGILPCYRMTYGPVRNLLLENPDALRKD